MVVTILTRETGGVIYESLWLDVRSSGGIRNAGFGIIPLEPNVRTYLVDTCCIVLIVHCSHFIDHLHIPAYL